MGTLATLMQLLEGDLDFHDQDSRYATHNFHSFPAKFPPQLPRTFIRELTGVGDIVLDPMMGSGTTIVEATLANRQAVGFDIDPLAVMLAGVKSKPLAVSRIMETCGCLLQKAEQMLESAPQKLKKQLAKRGDRRTRKFIDYWFDGGTQLALLALVQAIEGISERSLRHFFQLAFSATIISRGGGVSLAIDLAHTRPHRAKVVVDSAGIIQEGHDIKMANAKQRRYQTKQLKSVLWEFEKRVRRNVKGVLGEDAGILPPRLSFGNAQHIPLPANSVDLIVTSPPYASNAIDYMRTHKFSLAWLGYSIPDLGKKRKKYIGGEGMSGVDMVEMPAFTQSIVQEMFDLDYAKGVSLQRYYSEMHRVLGEMERVLKPNTVGIVVVGSSVMRGLDTKTHLCLQELGERHGLVVPKIGVRKLDRNRRMMPAGTKTNHNSQIQKRMHEEYVIGFYKGV